MLSDRHADLRHEVRRKPTLQLIDLAERNGNTRLAANHRQVAANLERVITALEAIDHEGPAYAS